jgi:hypothetical protein
VVHIIQGVIWVLHVTEAQVKELENSNRILRMKVVGSDDAVQHIKVNTNENMHTVPHCGPKRDENLHYTHQWQQNSDIQNFRE